jgi:hypothetical protein
VVGHAVEEVQSALNEHADVVAEFFGCVSTGSSSRITPVLDTFLRFFPPAACPSGSPVWRLCSLLFHAVAPLPNALLNWTSPVPLHHYSCRCCANEAYGIDDAGYGSVNGCVVCLGNVGDDGVTEESKGVHAQLPFPANVLPNYNGLPHVFSIKGVFRAVPTGFHFSLFPSCIVYSNSLKFQYIFSVLDSNPIEDSIVVYTSFSIMDSNPVDYSIHVLHCM